MPSNKFFKTEGRLTSEQITHCIINKIQGVYYPGITHDYSFDDIIEILNPIYAYKELIINRHFGFSDFEKELYDLYKHQNLDVRKNMINENYEPILYVLIINADFELIKDFLEYYQPEDVEEYKKYTESEKIKDLLSVGRLTKGAFNC